MRLQLSPQPLLLGCAEHRWLAAIRPQRAIKGVLALGAQVQHEKANAPHRERMVYRNIISLTGLGIVRHRLQRVVRHKHLVCLAGRLAGVRSTVRIVRAKIMIVPHVNQWLVAPEL